MKSKMYIADVQRFAPDYFMVRELAPGNWVARNTETPEVEFLGSTRRKVVATAKKHGASVIVEVQSGNDVTPIKLSPQEDYLRGLLAGVRIYVGVKEDMAHKGPRTHISWTHGRIVDKIENYAKKFYRLAVRDKNDPNLELAHQLNFYDHRARMQLPFMMTGKELRTLSPRIGVLEEIAGRAGVYNCYYLSNPKNKYKIYDHAAAISDLAKDKCPLVVRKTGQDRYAVLYADLDKSYLRGLFDVKMLVHYAQNAPCLAGESAVTRFENSLRALVNDCRENLGLTPLRKTDALVNFQADPKRVPANKDRSL